MGSAGGAWGIAEHVEHGGQREAMEGTEPLQVVICDDDPVMLQYLRELTEKALASEIFTVRTALAPGKLDAQARSAHILVLDIQMPEQSGIALAKTVSQ